ncbi:MAG: hypothetical protein U1F57_11825 [bacterium]
MGSSYLFAAPFPPSLTNSKRFLCYPTKFKKPGAYLVQSIVDGMVGGFAKQACDWRSLAAMAGGSLFYRVGRIGTLAFALPGCRSPHS